MSKLMRMMIGSWETSHVCGSMRMTVVCEGDCTRQKVLADDSSPRQWCVWQCLVSLTLWPKTASESAISSHTWSTSKKDSVSVWQECKCQRHQEVPVRTRKGTTHDTYSLVSASRETFLCVARHWQTGRLIMSISITPNDRKALFISHFFTLSLKRKLSTTQIQTAFAYDYLCVL